VLDILTPAPERATVAPFTAEPLPFTLKTTFVAVPAVTEVGVADTVNGGNVGNTAVIVFISLV
jgi:hypothetical protein